ncbi:hypothetical protein [Streptomyces sp. NPDC048248]|uniref:hypothetical protein n=1 Tax=Streptomyces sp. NPDC048248 TaxID=3365523 RepID=UPI003716B954
MTAQEPAGAISHVSVVTNCQGHPGGDFDQGIQVVATAYRAIPGIAVVSACAGHPGRDGLHAAWSIRWRLAPAIPGRPVAQAGAHPQGVVNTERLLAHVAMYDGAISRDLELPLPWPAVFPEHTPGDCLVFVIKGAFHGELRPVSPAAYLQTLKDHWAEVGFEPVNWP